MKRKFKKSIAVFLTLALFAGTLGGCGKDKTDDTTAAQVETTANNDLSETETEAETEEVNSSVENPQIEYSYATKEEGLEYLLSNEEFFDGFTQNDLDYKLQKKDATMEEYMDYAKEQVRDFTDEEKQAIDEIMNYIEVRLEEEGFTLPDIGPIALQL